MTPLKRAIGGLCPLLGLSLVLTASSPIGRPFRVSPRRASAPDFETEALALKAGGVLHALGDVRLRIIAALRPWRTGEPVTVAEPGPAQSPGTSIDRAIAEIERLTRQGADIEAFNLGISLARDLIQTKATGDLTALVKKWDARFPAERPSTGLTVADMDRLRRSAQEAHERGMAARPPEPDDPAARARQDAEDEAWIARLHRGEEEHFWRDLSDPHFLQQLADAAREGGYDSVADMIARYVEVSHVQTRFAVHLPPRLEELLGERSPLSLLLVGMPTAPSLESALQERHPELRYLSWSLHVDGEAVPSSTELVLPTQRVEIVLHPDNDLGTTPRPTPGRPSFSRLWRLWQRLRWPRSRVQRRLLASRSA